MCSFNGRVRSQTYTVPRLLALAIKEVGSHADTSVQLCLLLRYKDRNVRCRFCEMVSAIPTPPTLEYDNCTLSRQGSYVSGENCHQAETTSSPCCQVPADHCSINTSRTFLHASQQAQPAATSDVIYGLSPPRIMFAPRRAPKPHHKGAGTSQCATLSDTPMPVAARNLPASSASATNPPLSAHRPLP